MSKKKPGQEEKPDTAFNGQAGGANETPDATEGPDNSASSQLAYDDLNFLLRDELRPVRLLLEYTKPELVLQEHDIEHTVVVFGSARSTDVETAERAYQSAIKESKLEPDSTAASGKLKRAAAAVRHAQYYNQARELAAVIAQRSTCGDCPRLHVITGGGPGIMEAANRGAHDVGGKSIGLNIVLPREQQANPYITAGLCFPFHYFAIRKMHLLLRARALVVFPGGFGTLDEFFETLTLLQTNKIEPFPVLIFGKEYWQKLINFELLVEEGMIDPEHLQLFQYVDSVDEAWEIIRKSVLCYSQD
ncbi:MAG: TIGR00730 family Rossman fold protein [Proteobacteria bacterium]|nr:TIGR00730 family Rossman fold protein [Pseudomonadota bacterium]